MGDDATDGPRTPPPTALEAVATAAAPQPPAATRGAVVREFALFQLKLLTDGLKDLVLSPISIVVLVVGLLSPRRAAPLWALIYRVGRHLDEWIDLFPDPGAPRRRGAGPTMQSALGQAEELVVALRRGGVADPHVQAQLAAVVRTFGEAAPQPAATASSNPGA